MTRWPQLTPQAIGQLTPEQAIDLLAEDKTATQSFATRAEYNKWVQQHKQ